MNILMTGATGLVGRELGKALVQHGHRIFVITRDKTKTYRDLAFPCHVIEGDLMQEPLRDERLKHIEVVIHLAGEKLSNKRWSFAQKKNIYESRIKGTQNLIASLQDQAKLKLFISTSAVGFYGDRGSEILSEESPRGVGFLSDLCVDWEYPIFLAERKKQFPSCRYLVFRYGFVLSRQGGFLEEIATLFRLGAGFLIGNSEQWISWIHLQDLIRLYLYALEQIDMSGIVNAVSPEPIQYRDFAQKLSGYFLKSVRLQIPKTVLRFLFGEKAILMFQSERVLPRVLESSSFQYQFPSLEKAFDNLFSLEQKGISLYNCEQFLPYEIHQIEKHISKLDDSEIKLHSRLLAKVMSSWEYSYVLSPMSGGVLFQESIRYSIKGSNLFKIGADFLIRHRLNAQFQKRREQLSQFQIDG